MSDITELEYTVPQGATWTRRWEFYRDEARTEPIQFDGTTWRLQVKRRRALGATALLTVSSVEPTDHGSVITIDPDDDGSTHIVEILLSDEDTELLPAGVLYSDMKRRWASGREDRVFNLTLTIDPAVTDDE